MLELRKIKTLTTEGTEFHRGKLSQRKACLRGRQTVVYCGGSWMLSSCTSKISVELGGMVPSGVPFSP